MPKHHYVPRMLLKYFSTDIDKKYINIHLLKDNKFLYNMTLYEQAQKNNLYGSDQKLEKFYGGLESAASICLAKLNSGNINLSKEENWHIKLFLLNQLSRTPGFISSQDDYIEKQIKYMASHDKFLKNHLDDLSVGLNKPFNMYSSFSIDLLFIILDLRIGLLEADNVNSSFVIGQNPVILLNPYLKEKNWIRSTQGLALKGLIMIMPISHQYSLILYDGLRYKLINNNPKWIIKDSDVDKLNDFQYCNTNECIYFSNLLNEHKYSQKSNFYRNFRENNKANFEIIGSTIDDKTGDKIEITKTGLKEFPIEQNFNFLACKATEYTKPINGYNDAKREHIDETNICIKI